MNLCINQAHFSQKGPGFCPIIKIEIWEIRVLRKSPLATKFKKQAVCDASVLGPTAEKNETPSPPPHPRERIQKTGPDLLSAMLTKRWQPQVFTATTSASSPPVVQVEGPEEKDGGEGRISVLGGVQHLWR